MTITLEDIPELQLPINAVWQVKALVVDGRSPALDALESWSRQHPDDYKRILKSIRIAASQGRVTADRKHVGKNQNPKHGDVYEFIAYTGIARLMFFYDDRAGCQRSFAPTSLRRAGAVRKLPSPAAPPTAIST